jgi:hypothetical protein
MTFSCRTLTSTRQVRELARPPLDEEEALEGIADEELLLEPVYRRNIAADFLCSLLAGREPQYNPSNVPRPSLAVIRCLLSHGALVELHSMHQPVEVDCHPAGAADFSLPAIDFGVALRSVWATAAPGLAQWGGPRQRERRQHAGDSHHSCGPDTFRGLPHPHDPAQRLAGRRHDLRPRSGGCGLRRLIARFACGWTASVDLLRLSQPPSPLPARHATCKGTSIISCF